jgi:hypothetical protein
LFAIRSVFRYDAMDETKLQGTSLLPRIMHDLRIPTVWRRETASNGFISRFSLSPLLLADYKKVQIKQFPKTVKTSAETRYWQSFKVRKRLVLPNLRRR